MARCRPLSLKRCIHTCACVSFWQSLNLKLLSPQHSPSIVSSRYSRRPRSVDAVRCWLLRNVNSSIGSGTRNRRFTLPTAAVGGRSSRGENQSALGSYCSARRHVVRCVFEEIVLLQGDACKLFVPSLRVRVRAMTNSPMIHCCLLCSMALPTIFGVWSACWLRGFEQVLGMVRIRACNRCVSAHLCTCRRTPPPIFYKSASYVCCVWLNHLISRMGNWQRQQDGSKVERKNNGPSSRYVDHYTF